MINAVLASNRLQNSGWQRALAQGLQCQGHQLIQIFPVDAATVGFALSIGFNQSPADLHRRLFLFQWLYRGVGSRPSFDGHAFPNQSLITRLLVIVGQSRHSRGIIPDRGLIERLLGDLLGGFGTLRFNTHRDTVDIIDFLRDDKVLGHGYSPR